MRCPVDNETLVMADRGGVEIDYCPKCRGVWLDRGELDKIIDRAAGETPVAAAPAARATPQNPPPVYQPEPQRPHGGYRRDHDDDDDYRGGYGKRRKKSILGEIFDF
ncbi:MAG: zf-TFIIB domain-containing protein [Pseudomonadota bacterium]